jgi:TMEM175 potassium channel family protein
MPKSRLEAFSDSIIAFAVTLLIYDFHLQNVDADIDNAGMIHALLALAPHFSIYVISFLVCTVWWMGHHMFIHDLDRVDSRLLWLNCMFLMWIAILPFPTGLLGHHPRQPVAIVLYGAVCAIACIFFAVMRWYASFRGHLMRREISDMKLRRDWRISLCFPFVYLAAAAVGFFYPVLGLLSYAAVPAFYTVSRLVKHQEPATSPANLSR